MLYVFTWDRQCDKYLEKMSNKTTQKKFYSAPEVVVTAKLTQQAKRRKMNRQIEAFNKARSAKQRYFYLDGKWYTTQRKGESKEQWWNNTVDNITGAGSHNVQTDVSAGWENRRKGQYAKGSDGKVVWVEFTGKSNAGPVGARGQYYNDHLGYVEADIPTDNIKYDRGTDRGKSTTNTRTGVTIGKPGDDGKAERAKTNRQASQEADQKAGNWDAADFVDAIMPTNAIANGVSYIFDKMTGNTYVPMIAQSGFNPFGYAKDLAKGNIGKLLMRGIDAYATLGAPGLAEGIDYLGTRFAPKIGSISAKSGYIPKRANTPSGELSVWNQNSLKTWSGEPAQSFGRRSMERAANEGVKIPGMRWGNNAARSVGTGTTYTYNATTHPYDIMVDRSMQIAPYGTALTDVALQQIANNK